MKPHEWKWAVRDMPLDRMTKAVAWALETRMKANGECWPSKRQLAHDTGYSKRGVDIAIGRLEFAGLLEVRRGGGRGHTNHYTLKDAKGAHSDAKGCTQQHIKGAPIAPEVRKRSKKEVRARAREGVRTRPPAAAEAASAVFAVDALMLQLARGWLETH